MLGGVNDNREIIDIQKKLFREQGSALSKYQELVVGRRGVWSLLKYEMITTFLGGVPGALGLVLRRLFYPFLLGAVGKNVVFGTHVILRHPHKIFIGDNVVIDDNCLLDAKGDTNRGISIGSNVFIGRNSILHCKNGDIVIRDDVNIGYNCDLASSNHIEIGEKVLIAAYSYIVGGGHEFTGTDQPIMDQPRIARPVKIGANTWIGAGVTVLDGVTIGSGAIIGTGAVVTSDIPDNVLAVGMPARVLRPRGVAER